MIYLHSEFFCTAVSDANCTPNSPGISNFKQVVIHLADRHCQWSTTPSYSRFPLKVIIYFMRFISKNITAFETSLVNATCISLHYMTPGFRASSRVLGSGNSENAHADVRILLLCRYVLFFVDLARKTQSNKISWIQDDYIISLHLLKLANLIGPRERPKIVP